MSVKKEFPLVYIEWEDSHSTTGSVWKSIETVQESGPCVVCRSVGWLVEDHKNHKTVVGSISYGRDDGGVNQVSGDMTIPTSAIRKLVRLPKQYRG